MRESPVIESRMDTKVMPPVTVFAYGPIRSSAPARGDRTGKENWIWNRTGFGRRCRMGTTTRSFGDICVACVIAAIVAVSLISLGVVAWVALL